MRGVFAFLKGSCVCNEGYVDILSVSCTRFIDL